MLECPYGDISYQREWIKMSIKRNYWYIGLKDWFKVRFLDAETVTVRARNKKGHFVKDDPKTEKNEAYKTSMTKKPTRKAKSKKTKWIWLRKLFDNINHTNYRYLDANFDDKSYDELKAHKRSIIRKLVKKEKECNATFNKVEKKAECNLEKTV